MAKKKQLQGEEALADLLKGIDANLAPSAEIGDIVACDRKTLTLHEPAVIRKDEDGSDLRVRAIVKLPPSLIQAKAATEAAKTWWNTNHGMMMQADAGRWKEYIEGAREFWWLRVKMAIPIEMSALQARPEMLGLHYQESTGEAWLMEGEVDDHVKNKLKSALEKGGLMGIKVNGNDMPTEMMDSLLQAFKAWKKNKND